MSRFLRFFRVFVFAIVCMFGAFSANAATSGGVTVCDDSSDAGEACVRFDSARAGAPTFFTTPLSSNSHLTAFPYKPGYGYAGHYTGRECGGTQILDHTGAWTGNSVASGNIYACWVPLVRGGVSNPSPYYRLFILNGNGGTTGNTLSGYAPVEWNTNDALYGGNGRSIRIENRGDWLYIKSYNNGNYVWAWTYYNGQANVMVSAGGAFLEPAVLPQRSGYVFGGFYANSSGTGMQYIGPTGDDGHPTSAMFEAASSAFNTIHARWNAMTVNLSGNYATPNPVYFNGTSWYSDINATSPISGVTVSSNGNLTFNGYRTGENGGGVRVIDENGHFVTPADSYVGLIHDGSTLYPKWTSAPTWATLTIDNQNGSVWSLYYPLSGCSMLGYHTTPYCLSTNVVTSISIPNMAGWSYGGHWDGTGTQYIGTDGTLREIITGPTTVYANWTFGVSYTAGTSTGGSAPSGPTVCTYGTTCNAPENTNAYTNTNPNMQFAGWACSLVGATGDCARSKYTTGQSLLGATNNVSGATGITLTATWESNVTYYKLTLKSNNGQNLIGNTDPYIYEGYNAGFYKDDNDTYPITASIFAPLADGGAGISRPTNGNAIFKGYYLSTNGGEPVIDADGIIQVGPTQFNADRILYAQWLSPQTVTLDPGEHGKWLTCGVQSIQVVPGDLPLESQLSCGPTAESDWIFLGYYDSDDDNATLYYDSNLYARYPNGLWPDSGGPTELIARYEPVTYEVKYYCGGNTPVWTDNVRNGQQYTVWDGVGENACDGAYATSSNAGSKLVGWGNGNTGTSNNVTYSVGQNFGSFQITGNINLSMVQKPIYYVSLTHCNSSSGSSNDWSCDTYPLGNNPEPDVAYFSNGGWYSDAWATTPLTVMYPKPTRPGFDLLGYYTGQNVKVVNSNGNFIDVPNAIVTTGAAIVARWQPTRYEVRLNRGTGSGGPDHLYYRIDKGWSEDADFTGLPEGGITEITTAPTPPTGQMFSGYWTQDGTNGEWGTQVISGSKTILVTGFDDVTGLIASLSDGEIYARYENIPPVPSDPNEYFAVTTTALNAGETFRFTLSAGGNFYIDWGDGTVDNIVRNWYIPSQYVHTYTSAAPNGKTIKIWGNADGYAPDVSAHSAIYFSQGTNAYDSNNTPLLIAGISGSLGAVFPTVEYTGMYPSTMPTFYATFSGCSNLTTDISTLGTLFSWVENGVRHGVTGATVGMFARTFENTGITGNIPVALFAGVSGAANGMFHGTFEGCTGIESIPAGLFSGVFGVANYMFYETFEGCTGITSIPVNLFSGISGAASGMFFGTFAYTNIESIPEGLFSGISGAADNMFYVTFAGTNITSIPEGLFSGISGAADWMFASTFAGTNIMSLPHGLFSGVTGTAYHLFYNTFGGCSGLAGKYIPKDLFNLNGLTYDASNGMMNEVFTGSGLVTDCADVDLTRYPTNFESYWGGAKICAPAAVFSCENPSFGGTGTPSPDVIWIDEITGSTTLPAATNCTAATNYTKPSTAYWACTGNTNCTGNPNHWAAGGTKPSWLTSSVNQSVNFYMEYVPAEYSVTLDPNGGTAGSVTTLYETYNTKWATTSGGTAITSLNATQLPTRTNYTFTGYYDHPTNEDNQMVNADGQIVATTTTLTDNTKTWYAHWQTGPYTVTFRCDVGGNPITGYVYNNNVNYGDSINVPATSVCTKTGYTFTQWKIVANGVLIDETNNGGTYAWNYNFGSDVVPNWSPVQTTITLNPHLENGDSGSSDEGQTAVYTRYGDGVFRNSGRTQRMRHYEASDSYPLTALPQKDVDITFNLNSAQAVLTVGGQDYTDNNPLSVPIGLRFAGYYNSAAGGTKMIRGNFDDNGGVEQQLAGYITYDGTDAGVSNTGDQTTWHAHWLPKTVTNDDFMLQNMSLTGLIPTRAGYVFTGWWTSADESGDQITNGAGSFVGTADPRIINAHTPWYAHWEQCSHTLPADSHSTMSVGTLNNQCNYTITCAPCTGTNPAVYGCYTQNGGLTNSPWTFDVLTQGTTSGELSAGVCHAREYNIEYSNLANHNATMPGTEPTSYLYGTGTEINANNATPISPTEVFESWCVDEGLSSCVTVSQAQQQGYYYQIGNTEYGNKTYYAKWSDTCNDGYAKYSYDVFVTSDYDGQSHSYPAGTCAPGNYVITCNSNCPLNELCSACLEEFVSVSGNPLHLGQRYGVYSQGWETVISAVGALGAVLPSSAGIYPNGNYLPFGTNYGIRPLYSYTGIGGGTDSLSMPDYSFWLQNDYEVYMRELARLHNKTFGVAHYTFNGLWTDRTSEEDQYRYLPTVNGTTPWSQMNADGKALSEFFTSDTTVYAHWIPDVYTVILNKNGGVWPNGAVQQIYEQWNTPAEGWSTDGTNFLPATGQNSFVISSDKRPTLYGHDFDGYWTNNACDGTGTKIINSDGTLNTNAASLTGTVDQAKYFDTNGSTLYACWNPVQTTITLDNASATVNGTASLTAVYGEGAYLDVNGTPTLMTTSGPAITLPRHEYTVSFNMNYSGAPTGPDAQTPGWPFKGYFNSASGSRQFIGSDGKITSTGAESQYGASGYTTDQTWYAQWTAQSATLDLPTVYDTRTGHAFGRQGYVFTGWWTTADDTGTNLGGTNQYIGGTDTYSVTDAVVDSNYAKTLYAHWEPCTYTGATNATNVAITNADTNVCVYTITCPANYACGGNSGCEIEGQPNSYAPVALPECVGADFTITYYDATVYSSGYANPVYNNAYPDVMHTDYYSYDPENAFTLWTPDGDILAAHHASSVTWCRNADGTNCINSTTIPADSGNVTLYAQWTCATGYRTYTYATKNHEYGDFPIDDFPAGTCAPARYLVNCDKNCPTYQRDGGTQNEVCNACLEDFKLLSESESLGKYRFGNVYNGMAINGNSMSCVGMIHSGGLLPTPVYQMSGVPSDDTLFRKDASDSLKYATDPCWLAGLVSNETLVEGYYDGNYRTFMTAVGDMSYNSGRSFGATHYDFGGLWTGDGINDDGGDLYIGADGLSPTGGRAFDTQEMANMFTSDTTVYAHWTPKKYRVILDKNADDAVAGTVGEVWEKWNDGWALTQNGTYNSTRTLSGDQLPTRTGYTFAGYFDTSAETGGNAMGTVSNGVWTTPSATATDANPATWYARWTGNQYTVTYNCGIGTGAGSTDTATFGQSYTPKGLAAAGCDTALVGHYFNGWNVRPGHSNSDIKYAGDAFDWDYTENQTFTARWVAKTYHITFAKNGGNGGTNEIWEHYGDQSSGFWHDASQNHVTSITLPNKEGYTFMGYVLSGTPYISSATLPPPNLTFGDTSDSSIVDVTLTAQWGTNTYNIQYNLGGGTTTLPVGYVPVEYIEFNGNQVIDTGFTIEKDYEIQTKFYPAATGKYVYGALSSGNSKTVSGYVSASGDNWRWGNKAVSKALSLNSAYTIVQNASALTVNGIPVAYETQNEFETDVTLSIGKAHSASGGTNYDSAGFQGRMYWFIIKDDNGNVVYHGVPVKDTATGQYGLCNIMAGGTCVTVSGIAGPMATLPTSYSYGTATTVSGTPSRANSVFQSWCPTASLTNCATPHEITATDSGNITLYAKWNCDVGYSSSSNNACVANHIILNWDENNGVYPEILNGECTYNGDLGLPMAPAYDTAHVFNGWKTYNNSGIFAASSTVNGGCVQTYTGVTSGTSTAIQAQWCDACNPTHATCILDASTPGTCSYVTACESEFYHYVSGEGAYNPVCAPYTITYQSQDSNGVSRGDGAVQEILSNPFITNDATDSAQFNWANHIVTAWTHVSGGNFPNVGGSYTYNVQSDTVLKANWGECQCTPGTNATSCLTTSSNNTCEVSEITCAQGYTGTSWSCNGTDCTATCTNSHMHMISLRHAISGATISDGTKILYAIDTGDPDAGVYLDSGHGQLMATDNNPITLPTPFVRTVLYEATDSDADIVTLTTDNTTATATFNGYYDSYDPQNGTTQYITGDTGEPATSGYITSDGISNGTTPTSSTQRWWGQWTPGSVTLPIAYRPGYTFAGWYSVGGTRVGGAGDLYTPMASSVMLHAEWTQCADGEYCPGSETMNNQTVYNVVHDCPSTYPNSMAGSTSISDCYLILTPGYSVEVESAGMVACPQHHYCDDDTTKIYYSGSDRVTTGNKQSCAGTAGSFTLTMGTGKTSISACYKDVTLDKRGGTSGSTPLGGAIGFSSGSTPCNYGTACTLPDASILTLSGYTFYAGWTVQPDTDCNDNTNPFIVSPSVPDNIDTYYACRTTNSYTVALKDGLNTSVTFESVTPSYNQPMPTPLSVTPTHTGGNAAYVFTGYYDQQTWTSNQTKYYNYDLTSAHDWQTPGNGTLYAQWEITCNPGYYLKANETVCSLCPAGKYCDGNQSFVYIPWNTDQGITGDIAAGYYSTGGASTATPTAHVTSGNGCYGQVNNANTACGLVAGGYYSTGGGTSATPTATGNGCLASCGKVGVLYYSGGGGITASPTSTGCVSGQTCGRCPSKYQSNQDTGKAYITQCTATCVIGTQVETAETRPNNPRSPGCTTPEGDWYSPAEHIVNYGSASTHGVSGQVRDCATNYTIDDGVTPVTTDHDEQKDCKRTVELSKNGGSGIIGDETDPDESPLVKVCSEGETCNFGDPSVLQQPGWNFLGGWGTTASCNNNSTQSFTTPTESRYYACKSQGSYTLTYSCGTGATGPAPAQQTNIHYGDTVSVSGVGNCAKTGHSFAGWVDSSNAAVQPDNSGNITWEYTSNQTFTAQWTANTYNISYEENGGSRTESSNAYPLHYTYGVETTVTGGATRANSVFEGWCRNAALTDGCTMVPHVITATEYGDKTLYAQWGCVTGYHLNTTTGACDANEFTLVYNANGHDVANQPASQTCSYGYEISLAGALSETGWNFGGWTIAGEPYAGGQPIVCNENYLGVTGGAATTTVNVVADWSPKCNRIILNKNSGAASYGSVWYLYAKTRENGSTIDGKLYKDSTCMTEYTPADVIPTRGDGWTFRGFYATSANATGINATQTNGAEQYLDYTGALTSAGQTFINGINANTVFYAGWAQDCVDPVAHGTCSRTIGQNTTYTTTCANGYDYGTAPDGVTYSPATSGNTSESTYYPNCVANTITITLDKNGGTGTCGGASEATAGTLTCVYNGTCNTPVWDSSTCRLSKTGKIFAGWNTAADGTGTSYGDAQNAASIDTTDATILANGLTLYAVWEDVQCNVTNGTATVAIRGNTPYCRVSCENGYEPSTQVVVQGEQHDPVVNTGMCNAATYDINYHYDAEHGGALASLLPEGYTQLEYVTADGRQYFDTGVVLTNTSNIENVMEIQATSFSGFQTWTGFMKTSATTPRYGINFYSNKWMIGINATSSNGVTADSGRHIVKFVTTNNAQILYDTDGTTELARSSLDANALSGNVLPLYIGARNNSGTPVNFVNGNIGRIYLKQNGVELYHYIPVQRDEDDAVGFYDTVSGEFLRSATANDFVAGPVVTVEYPERYTYGTGATVYGGATRANSVFEGWCRDAALTDGCTMVPHVIGTTEYGDKDLYAKWSCVDGYHLDGHSCVGNLITIDYQNGGHGGTAPSDVTQAYGTTLEHLADAMYDAQYDFGGWMINGDTYGAGDPITLDHNTLGVYSGTVPAVAQWAAGQFRVTYDCNTQWPGAVAPGSRLVFTGSLFRVALAGSCVNPGYRFVKWAVSDTSPQEYWNAGAMVEWNYAENKTFSAVWERDEDSAFTVTVNMPAGTEFKFKTIASGQFWVDWGDNDPVETQNTPTTVTEKTWTHTYATAGEHVINIGGQASGYYTGSSGTSTLTKAQKSAISFFNGTMSATGGVDATVTTAGTEQYITAVSGNLGAIFPTIGAGTWGGQPRFYRTFKNTTNMQIRLQSIENLFEGVSGQPMPYMFAETFDGSGVKDGIPENFFRVSGAPQTSLFQSTFRNCTGLTGTIPANLFVNISGAAAEAMFSRTFKRCTGLTGIPAGLFRNISGAPAKSMFSNTFSGCTEITGTLSGNLFGTMNGPLAYAMFNRTFENCSKLVGDTSDSTVAIPSGLFGTVGQSSTAAMYAFYRTFYGCAALRGKIGGALFSGLTGNPAEYMFSNTFNTCGDRDMTTNCSNLNGTIPTNLFGNMTGAPKSHMFSATFKGASHLTGTIPDRLFGRITGVPAEAMFDSTFYGCSGLGGTIPAHLFDGISGQPADYMFQRLFKDCSGLTGIGGALFGQIVGEPANSMFYATFMGCSDLSGSIPNNLFGQPDGSPKSQMFMDTFNGCSGLTGEIPSGLFGSLSGSPAEYMFCRTFKEDSGLTGTIPTGLFGTLSGDGVTYMFAQTFYNCSGLTGYIPEGLFGTMAVPSSVPTGMMSKVFAGSGLDTVCPCGTTEVQSAFKPYWDSLTDATTPDKVSCRVGLKPDEHWYNGICTTKCSDTAIDELHVGNLNPYIVLSGQVSTRTIAVKNNDTICYIPLASGASNNNLNVKYGNSSFHFDRPDDTPPAGFGQR